MRVMKDQRPYYATRAELRAIDEGLAEKPVSAGAASLELWRRLRPLDSKVAKRHLAAYRRSYRRTPARSA